MIYTLTDEYQKISGTKGTMQNTSPTATVEVSNSSSSEGILLFPYNKFTWSGATIYARIHKGTGPANLRVVPFVVDGGGSSGSASGGTDGGGGTSDDIYSSDEDLNEMLKDVGI